MTSTRKAAQKINPLIGKKPDDTFENISELIELIWLFKIYAPALKDVLPMEGSFRANEIVKAAMDFEIENY